MTIASCPPRTPPTLGIVVYNDGEFKAQYPEFATVASGLLQSDFVFATMVVSNCCGSLVKDAVQRQTLLYLLTAHIAALLQGVNGQPPQGVVGRLDSATEGAVSLTAAYSTQVSQSQAWFIQTKYGAMFWQMTSPYRTMRYIGAPVRVCCGGCGTLLGPTGSGCGCGYNGGSA